MCHDGRSNCKLQKLRRWSFPGLQTYSQGGVTVYISVVECDTHPQRHDGLQMSHGTLTDESGPFNSQLK
jgi:hypothetical protein